MKTPRKRRIQSKTDYRKRMAFLKSGKPRIVVRRTNKYLIIQYVKSVESKDSVILGITSKELLKYGWPKTSLGSLKSITAAYLAGYLVGRKIVKKEKKHSAIADIGIHRNVHGSRIYSAIKGIVDAGVNLSYDNSVAPSEDRIKGRHLSSEAKNVFEKVKEAIDKQEQK